MTRGPLRVSGFNYFRGGRTSHGRHRAPEESVTRLLSRSHRIRSLIQEVRCSLGIIKQVSSNRSGTAVGVNGRFLTRYSKKVYEPSSPLRGYTLVIGRDDFS